jgi:hypothetical protein
LLVGARSGGSNNFNGYISNIRVVKGSAVYDTTQTTIIVPSGPLQAITNTSLLTCAYPTFRDGSSNNFTITVNGNTAVSTQNPFPQTQLPNPALGNQGNGVYSMSQYQALRSQNLWPAIDQYWPYVTMMLHGNGTNGAQNNTFLDSSTNNFTITRNGNTTQGTFTPYGANWSNYFDGSGDYLSIPSSAGLRFDGQFCVEGWVNFNAFNTQNFLISQFTAAGEAGWIVRYTGTALRLYAQNGAVTIDRTWSPSRGVWYHFAVTRDSNNDIRFFIDGTQLGATATGVSTTMSSTNTAYIGGHPDIANDTNAYLSNMRVVKGSAVYTANFTPSTAPLTAITNTSLLTCQSNRFIDNSSNNFTITRNGDVSVQRFSPFNPTAPYAAGTDGGSGYFDGTGDNLRAGNNAAFDFGTGSFTLEAWVYPTAATPNAYGVVLAQEQNNGQAAWGVSLALSPSNVPTLFASASSGGYAVQISGSSAPMNTWTHLAAVRNGNTFTLYVNGVSAATTTSTVSITQQSSPYGGLVCGGSSAVQALQFVGMISNARVVNGSAVYTAGFTPPTAPLTAITNTSLLTNFTNAGIIDNAEMNNLETVGNAQISTAQSKFGGASMLFDGSGDGLRQSVLPIWSFGSENFTIECWVYPTAFSAGSSIIVCQNQTNGSAALSLTLALNASGQPLVLAAASSGGYAVNFTGTALSLNTWTHLALTRSGNTFTLWRNGTSDGTASSSVVISQDTASGGYGGWNVGYSPITGQTLTGYIDDLRITKGYARYTSTFTPQRSQWQDQ